MNIDLTGRKAVVTGSTAGIGRAIAEGLARAGAAVVINGRGRGKGRCGASRACASFSQRLSSPASPPILRPRKARRTCSRRRRMRTFSSTMWARGARSPSSKLSDSEWIDLFELNVMSGIRASRHYVPNMTKRGWGRVVFISSESALAIPKDMIDYAMTKTAQLAISRGLAEVVGGTGVTVNSVLPGPTNSEIMGGWMKANAEAQGITQEEAEQQFLKTMRPTTLLNRFATTEEVANLVVYVCSEQASATTGTSLRVDGGVVRTIA
jgi:NAD(P)-dependent dehydrogenase (short-subunit alcohol dehydrogenase family)